MGFENEKKIFENPEKLEPNIYSLSKYEYLQNHLKYKIIIDCMRDLHKQKISLIDYGCGNAQLTRILEMLNNNEQKLKNIKIQVTGYEPDKKLIDETIESNLINFFDRIQYTSDKPNEEADIVLCYFSLHHMENFENILKEEIKQKLNPQYLVIGELDYKRHNITMQEFNKLFLSTESGKDELARYKKQYGGEEGLKVCYNAHMKIGLQDCLNALDGVGYDVKDIAMGNMENPTQAMKFLIKAKRAELGKLNMNHDFI